MAPIMLGVLSWQLNVTLSVVIVLLICFSAFFSSTETAYTSVSSVRMKYYADQNKKGARKAMWICDHYDLTLSTILVGNNLVNIAATTICAFLFANAILDPTVSNIVNTVVMTVALLIFGEITPKTIAKQNAEKFALKCAGTMYVVIKILFPITFLFNKFQQLLMRKNKNKKAPAVTEKELETIIDTMEEEGVIDSKDADLIQGVLDLDQKIVRSAMTHRVDVTAVAIDDSIEDIKQTFLETKFSRLPVFEGDMDHVVGILSEKDFFSSLMQDEVVDLKKLIAAPMFVNENMKLDDLVRKMQSAKKHIAIVVEEHGGTSGIITLEDAIEEVLGEIYDEHDDVEAESNLQKIENNTFIADAEIELDELFEKLGLNITENQYSSLGAFLFALAESIPKQGQVLTYKTTVEKVDDEAKYHTIDVNFVFKLIKVENKRIREVEIKVEEKPREE